MRYKVINIFNDEDFALWRILNQTRNAIQKVRARELSRYNITPRKAAILLLIYATEGNINSYRIAKWLVLERHSISELIDRMEQQDLIKKVKSGDRRKSIKLEITDKGRLVAEKAGKGEAIHTMMQILTQKERKQLTPILKRLRDRAFEELGITGQLPYPPY